MCLLVSFAYLCSTPLSGAVLRQLNLQHHMSARVAGPAELPLSEGVVSMAWLPDKPDMLAAGIGTKWLRLFDVRAGTAHTVSSARGAYSLSADPHSCNLLASFSRVDVSWTTHCEYAKTRPLPCLHAMQLSIVSHMFASVSAAVFFFFFEPLSLFYFYSLFFSLACSFSLSQPLFLFSLTFFRSLSLNHALICFTCWFQQAIKLWDLRKFQEPVHSIHCESSQSVVSLQWCPTR